jgi:hypothetical protein
MDQLDNSELANEGRNAESMYRCFWCDWCDYWSGAAVGLMGAGSAVEPIK